MSELVLSNRPNTLLPSSSGTTEKERGAHRELSQLAGELKGAGKSYDGSWDPRHVQIDALLASQECSVHCAFMIAFPVTDDKDRCLLHDKSLASYAIPDIAF